MSQEKMNRRRFLADLLFAGGAISAAALLAQSSRKQAGNPNPSPPPPPPEPPIEDVKLGGAVCPPQEQPSPPPPPPQPHPAGAPMPPRVKGDVAVPAPSPTPRRRKAEP